MKQFVLPNRFAGESQLALTGDDYHYLCTVRRYGVGDSFHALDREGKTYTATITRVDTDGCLISIEARASERKPGPFLTLYQCLPKGSKMDQIIRQGTEAGVRRFVPIKSEYTISNVDGKVEKKLARWRRIAEEAVQQSRAPTVPEIHPPLRVSELESVTRPDELPLYFDSDGESSVDLHYRLSNHEGPIGVAIGPEGGWSDADHAALTAASFLPAFLGSQVLRTETAAVYAVAAIQIIALEKDKWSIRSG